MDMLSKVRAGEIPEQPSDQIDTVVWGLLDWCWSKSPMARPPLVELYDSLSNLSSHPRVTPQKQQIEELPRELSLWFWSITPSPTANLPRGRHLYLKLEYGGMDYRTSPTTHEGYSGRRSWHVYTYLCPLPAAKSHTGSPQAAGR